MRNPPQACPRRVGARPVMTLGASGSLDPKGPSAEAIAVLWWVMLGLGVAVFLLFAVLLAVGLFRRRPGEGDPETAQPSQKRWLLGGGVVLPLIVLTVVFGATLVAMRALPSEEPPGALVIEVTGHQWWFEVVYPEEGVSVADEMHLPVGRPVVLRLTSADVIHSFWVPELGGKLDMLPDGVNVLQLQADEAGEWGAQCAEFCGLEHATMRVHVVAESPADFDAWIQEQQR